MANKLYGARYHADYFWEFFDKYDRFEGEVLSNFEKSIRDQEVVDELMKTMDVGIATSMELAKRQAESLGFTVPEFCEQFNELINNFELLTYRSLEYTATDFAHRMTAAAREVEVKSKNRTVKQNLDKVYNEAKVQLKRVEESANKAIEEFWSSIVDGSSNPDFGQMIKQLTQARADDFLTNNGVYGPKFAGDIGELQGLLLLDTASKTKDNFLNELHKVLANKGIKSERVGGELRKADLLFGEIAFSVKNYTAVRNRFMEIKAADEEKQRSSGKFTDIKIQSSGLLETVLTNFEKAMGEDSIAPGFYEYVMNALYIRNYGETDYYDIALNAIDLLVSTYAFVFLAQGTTKEAGYAIENYSGDKVPLPGFMWLTGRGIIPIYVILQSIKENFGNIINKFRTSNRRSGTYAYIKVRGAGEGMRTVDTHKRSSSPYGLEATSPSGAGWYLHTEWINPNIPSTYADREGLLQRRYSDFSKKITTSVRLHLELTKINEMIRDIKI